MKSSVPGRLIHGENKWLFFNSHCSQYIIGEKTRNEYVDFFFFIIINGITPCHAGVRVKNLRCDEIRLTMK